MVAAWMLASALAAGPTAEAPATAERPPNYRGSMFLGGSWAVAPQGALSTGMQRPAVHSCGGLGLNLVRGTRGGAVPDRASQRMRFTVLDVCGRVLGDEWLSWVAPLQLGYGVMAGGSALYAVAQVDAGLGLYTDQHGAQWVNQFGVTAKPRVAAGLSLGWLQLEAGPTARAMLPLRTRIHNAPGTSPVFGMMSFDVELHLGSSGPRAHRSLR